MEVSPVAAPMIRVPYVNGFPQHRHSNGGRAITVDRSEDYESVLVFTFEGREVAELHNPDDDQPARTDGLLIWRLTFPAYPETVVLGAPDDPPITNALDYVDQALDYEDED